MPSQVLGKVSVTPKGDYNSGTTYYALDIVGYEGGSYLAMKEVTGVEPSNDQTNWMQLSGPGLPGVDGVTFTPSVSEAGVISWTNDGEEENPDPVDIMGPPGTAAGFGTVTATADNTSSETPSVDVQSSGPDTAKNFTFAFTGLKGKPGETPDITIGTVTTLEPGQDATAEITGTTPDLVLSLGLPKGQPGTSVSRIQRTDGTGAPGTTDTYTMYSTDGSTIGTFTVYNGQNGTGAGDFLADGSVPMTGNLDMNGNRVTEVGTPTAETDATNKNYVDSGLSNKQDTLSGTEDQLVGFNSAGEATAVAKPTYTAADVGAMPAVTGGATGQVLTKTEAGQEWQDPPSGLPSGGSAGQYLSKTASGAEWATPDWIPYSGESAVTDANSWLTNGYTKTSTETANLPSECTGLSMWGVLFFIAENTEMGTGTQMYYPIDGDQKGAVFTRSLTRMLATESVVGEWVKLAVYPAGGTQGQVLTKGDGTAVEWGDPASGLPSGGTTGQMLYRGESGPEWGDKPDASSVDFTTGTTGLTSGNVQDAIEEVNEKIPSAPKSVAVTLSSTGWSSNTQTVTVQGVKTSGQSVRISPATKTDADNWVAAGVWCSEPTTANQLVFTCDTAPTENININVELQEVQS